MKLCKRYYQYTYIPCFSSSFPSFSPSSLSFPLSCWPSGSFLVEVNKSAMVSADTGGGGPLIGPVSTPAVLTSFYLFILFIHIYIYIYTFLRTLSLINYMCTVHTRVLRSGVQRHFGNALGLVESLFFLVVV